MAKRRRRPMQQPSLFDGLERTPRWETLPSAVRAAALPLLARMLREHRRARSKARDVQEVVDE